MVMPIEGTYTKIVAALLLLVYEHICWCSLASKGTYNLVCKVAIFVVVKASSLYDNQDLACNALQYIKAPQGDSDAVGGPDAKKPPDSAFAETFAPTCGVQTSTLAPITGRLIGCQSKYVHADEAFSKILIENSKVLDILYDKNHTEVGAAASGGDGGAPYFWCVLFSSGKTNSTFVTEGGEAKITRPGCFSGANDDCSESNHPANGADDWSRSSRMWPFFTTALIAMSCAFGL